MSDHGSPPLGLLAAEPARAIAEYAMFLASGPLLARAPRGDGHPVLVLPGLGADDGSTRALRAYLRGRGHQVHGWRLGRNVGPTAEVVAGLTERLTQLADRDGRTVSIVGRSLGGIYARRLAHRSPDRVRQVVTLGSPFRQSSASRSHADWLYARHARRHVRPPSAGMTAAEPVPVPATAIYSKTDGVVDWRACLEVHGPQSENIEVLGSHCGLGHNPVVAWIVADRLAQPEGGWAAYAPGSAGRLLLDVGRRRPR